MITFADIELVVEDEEGQVADWLLHNLSTKDMRTFGWIPVSVEQQFTSKLWGGIPVPNYGHALQPKLNTLYWPTGAGRWSFGLFLATTSQLNKIQQEIGDVGNPFKTLRIGETSTVTADVTQIAPKMHLLPPRPVSLRSLAGEGLWILPLVDLRYYWQFRNTYELSLGNTWEDVYKNLALRLGITLKVDPIGARYKCPNAIVDTKKYENAAVMLDAVAHMLGQRIVFDWASENGDDATEAHPLQFRAINFADPDELDPEAPDNWSLGRIVTNKERKQSGRIPFPLLEVAGDEFGDRNPAAAFPEKVTVVFRKRIDGQLQPNDYYPITVTASDLGYRYYAIDAVKIFRDTMEADVDSMGSSGSASNEEELQDMAEQIAEDYYVSLLAMHDRSYASIQLWKETAYDDYVEYSIGHRLRDGTFEARTRIHSAPYNFGIEELWHGECRETSSSGISSGGPSSGDGSGDVSGTTGGGTGETTGATSSGPPTSSSGGPPTSGVESSGESSSGESSSSEVHVCRNCRDWYTWIRYHDSVLGDVTFRARMQFSVENSGWVPVSGSGVPIVGVVRCDENGNHRFDVIDDTFNPLASYPIPYPTPELTYSTTIDLPDHAGSTDIHITVGTDPRILYPADTSCPCWGLIPGTPQLMFSQVWPDCPCPTYDSHTLQFSNFSAGVYSGTGTFAGREVFAEFWCSGGSYCARLKWPDECSCENLIVTGLSATCSPNPFMISSSPILPPCTSDCGPAPDCEHAQTLTFDIY